MRLAPPDPVSTAPHKCPRQTFRRRSEGLLHRDAWGTSGQPAWGLFLFPCSPPLLSHPPVLGRLNGAWPKMQTKLSLCVHVYTICPPTHPHSLLYLWGGLVVWPHLLFFGRACESGGGINCKARAPCSLPPISRIEWHLLHNLLLLLLPAPTAANCL